MNGFTYHELHTPNPEKAIGFYGELLGFKYEKAQSPMPYWTQKDVGGGLMNDERPHWLPYITVDDVSARAKQAEKLGGKVLQPPTPIPNVGEYAVLADPQGAVFAIWKEARV